MSRQLRLPTGPPPVTLSHYLNAKKGQNGPSPVLQFKVKEGTNTYQVHIQQCESSALENLGPHVFMYELATSNYTFQNPKKQYELFALTLAGTLRANWDTIVRDKNPNQTIHDSFRQLIAGECSNDTEPRRNQVEYVQYHVHWGEVPGLSLTDYHRACRDLNDMAQMFPGTKEKLSEADFREAFFRSLPATWRRRYNETHKNPDITSPTLDWTELLAFMFARERDARQLALDKAANNTNNGNSNGNDGQSEKRGKKRNSGNANGGSTNGGGSKRRKGNGSSNGNSGNNGNNGNNNGNNGNNGNNNRPKFTGVPCKHHGHKSTHTWEECSQNPANKGTSTTGNSNASSTNADSNGNGNSRKNRKAKRQVNYAVTVNASGNATAIAQATHPTPSNVRDDDDDRSFDSIAMLESMDVAVELEEGEETANADSMDVYVVLNDQPMEDAADADTKPASVSPRAPRSSPSSSSTDSNFSNVVAQYSNCCETASVLDGASTLVAMQNRPSMEPLEVPPVRNFRALENDDALGSQIVHLNPYYFKDNGEFYYESDSDSDREANGRPVNHIEPMDDSDEDEEIVLEYRQWPPPVPGTLPEYRISHEFLVKINDLDDTETGANGNPNVHMWAIHPWRQIFRMYFKRPFACGSLPFQAILTAVVKKVERYYPPAMAAIYADHFAADPVAVRKFCSRWPMDIIFPQFTELGKELYGTHYRPPRKCASQYIYCCKNHTPHANTLSLHVTSSSSPQSTDVSNDTVVEDTVARPSPTRLHIDRCAAKLQSAIHDVMLAYFSDTCNDHCFDNVDSSVGKPLHSSDPSENPLLIDPKLAPYTVIVPDKIQGKTYRKPLAVLCDTSADNCLIHQRALTAEITPTPSVQTLHGIGGAAESTATVLLENIILPELTRSITITYPLKCAVVSHDIPFDVLLGRDFMLALGIDLMHSNRTIKWRNFHVPFRRRDEQHAPMLTHARCMEVFLNDTIQPTIKEAVYNAVDTDAIAAAQTHLSPTQRDDLARLFREFPTLFDGKLRCYPDRKVHLELLEGATPIHLRPFAVPRAHEEIFKRTLEQMCKKGIIEKCGASEYAAPTFLIAKKDGTGRTVTDFRELNKILKRKIYLMPRIQDILRKRTGYKFFTKLDTSMMFYTFELDDESKQYCIMVTPWGKYRYNRLPMGLKVSPDIAQEIMEDLFREIDEVDVYIDDIGCFDDSWDAHLKTLRRVLSILARKGFALNADKSAWAVQETDWLGHWLTPIGLKPWRKKINAILQLDRPRTVKELRSFIGAVNFYRDMFKQRSHILAPLTDLTKHSSKKPLPWTEECSKAFNAIKAVMAKDALVRYPDHNLPFHVYADASDYQLGACIIQNGAPVAYYSRKLTAAQRNYTVGERELLSIVETLKEFRTMLFGCKELHVYTDHKNNTFHKLTSQRVLRWRLFLEEYQPIFHYVKGEDNGLADALSRLPHLEGQTLNSHNGPDDISDTFRRDEASESNDDSETGPRYAYSTLDDDDLIECFLAHPDFYPGIRDPLHPCPVEYSRLAELQAIDKDLLSKLQDKPEEFTRIKMDDNVDLICRKRLQSEGTAPWQICIPNGSLEGVVNWYHLTLSHTGAKRLFDTISLHFYHEKLRTRVDELVGTCDACQRYKLPGRGYGHHPPRNAEEVPWRVVAVDLIGPWSITVNGKPIEILALTIIDTVTNYPEIIRVNNKSAAHVGEQFENAWLSRYPCPRYVIYDHGTEFMGTGFQRILSRHGIHSRISNVKNPQSNSIIERLHQTVANVLRPLLHTRARSATVEDTNQVIDTALQTAAYAARAAVHTTLGISPGALAFQRDMILNIPLIADFKLLREKRQVLIDRRLMDANRQRISHDYQPGDKIMALVPPTEPKAKLSPRAEGPFTIHSVHTNGVVKYVDQHTIVSTNIRLIKPYREPVQHNPSPRST